MAALKRLDLPRNFLGGPFPKLVKTPIDFKRSGLPEYKGLWAVVLDGVMSQAECDMLLAATEATNDGKWERALVNIGGNQQAMIEDIRSCGRIINDDCEIVAKLWARIEGSVPEIHQLRNWPEITGPGPARRKEIWKVTRLNERMRFLKYVGGEYFKAHCDGTYETPDQKERSYFTLHLYLNDAAGQLEGGDTTFHSCDKTRDIGVEPKAGRVLLFQHRSLSHSGADVVKGVKYTMRTDVMYTFERFED